MIAEKAYEGHAHWLMFLFRCKPPLPALPPTSAKGGSASSLARKSTPSPCPRTDRTALWPIYDQHRDRFRRAQGGLRPGQPVRVEIEEIT